MNDETQRQLEQLERATAASVNRPLDAETAELRAGWLAFGRLLEAADTGVDEATVVRTIERAERRRRTVGLIVAAALAASLLLAVGVWHFTRSPTSPAISGPREIAVPTPVVKPPASKAAAVNAAFAWDDSLDSQLTQLQSDVAGFHYVQAPADASFSVLSDQMQTLGAEFSSEL